MKALLFSDAQALVNEHGQKVIIPEIYTSIADQAFYGLQLTSVEIPGSISTIGQYAFFENQLENIESKVNLEHWVEASDLLETLTKNLQKYEKSKSEAQELYSFVESEWIDLRKKLDSSSVKVNDPMRINAEREISESKRFLDEGDIDSTLSSLGKTDEIIENLRRRI